MTASAVPAIRESEAEGKVKAVFEDIKVTLNTPTVGLLFRRLAVYPWYLELAWRNLKPNAAISFFDRSADKIRQAASEAMSARVPTARETAFDADLASAVELFHDLNPKLLLVTGLLRAGTNGQVPKMNILSADEKRIVPIRQPVSNRDFDELESKIVDSKHENSIADVYTDTGISADQLDLSLLAASSTAFTSIWAEAKPAMERAEVDRAVAQLRTITLDATEAMPFRMEISATACRQSGLSEDQIDDARRIINHAWVNLPRLILAMAAIHAAGGSARQTEQLTSAVAAGS